MKIDKRDVNGVSILELEGKITIGKGDVALREAVQQLLAEGADKILIHLEKVTTIDSSGVGELGVAMMTMGVSVGLASLTGAVVVPLTILEPHMWMHPLIMMMAVVVLGGLGSLKGSFIGAYILGFAEAMVVFLAPMGAFLKGSVALSIMILVLLIRPEGLFGVSFEEER